MKTQLRLCMGKSVQVNVIYHQKLTVNLFPGLNWSSTSPFNLMYQYLRFIKIPLPLEIKIRNKTRFKSHYLQNCSNNDKENMLHFNPSNDNVNTVRF